MKTWLFWLQLQDYWKHLYGGRNFRKPCAATGLLDNSEPQQDFYKETTDIHVTAIGSLFLSPSLFFFLLGWYVYDFYVACVELGGLLWQPLQCGRRYGLGGCCHLASEQELWLSVRCHWSLHGIWGSAAYHWQNTVIVVFFGFAVRRSYQVVVPVKGNDLLRWRNTITVGY
jgi:hypothetical protein